MMKNFVFSNKKETRINSIHAARLDYCTPNLGPRPSISAVRAASAFLQLTSDPFTMRGLRSLTILRQFGQATIGTGNWIEKA